MMNNYQEKEYYIFMGDLCNFACKHCVTLSNPKAKKYKITDNELKEIASNVNNNDFIKSVHFIGGEPTLFLEEISTLQNLITRPVEYAITTNGWFYRTPSKVLDKVKVDKLLVSFDKFHGEFIEFENIVLLLEESTSRNIKTLLLIVYENLKDLAIDRASIPKEVEICSSFVTESGSYLEYNQKSKNLRKTNVLEATCPSLNTRESELEKIVFIPAKGHTPCCSNLVFNSSHAMPDSLFSPDISNYFENDLYKKLSKGNFKQQFENLGFNTNELNFDDPCSACSFLYQASTSGIPSTSEIINQEKKVQIYSYKNDIEVGYAQNISQKVNISYIMVGQPIISPSSDDDVSSSFNSFNISVKKIKASNLSDIKLLIDELFLDPKTTHFNDQEKSEFWEQLKQYFSIYNPECNAYYYKGLPIGVIGFNFFDESPYTKRPACHIGLIGYKTTKEYISKIRAIRNHMIDFIAKANRNNNELTANIFWYNRPSLNFAKKIGMTPKQIKVEKR